MALKTKHLVSGYRVPGEPISLDEMKTFLWGAATRLRGQIDAAGYKEYIFPLLFFKRISDVYDEQYNGFLREGGEEYAGMQVEDLAIKIPQGAHWDDVREVTENVGQRLVEAFIAIEQANPGEEVDGRVVGGLEGIFGPKDGWTNRTWSMVPRRLRGTAAVAVAPRATTGVKGQKMIRSGPVNVCGGPAAFIHVPADADLEDKRYGNR